MGPYVLNLSPTLLKLTEHQFPAFRGLAHVLYLLENLASRLHQLLLRVLLDQLDLVLRVKRLVHVVFFLPFLLNDLHHLVLSVKNHRNYNMFRLLLSLFPSGSGSSCLFPPASPSEPLPPVQGARTKAPFAPPRSASESRSPPIPPALSLFCAAFGPSSLASCPSIRSAQSTF